MSLSNEKPELQRGYSMEVPPEITFRGLEKTEAIEAHIYRWTDKLDEIHSGIISCRIAVENDQEHQRSGSPFRVRVVVRVPPGKELIGRHEAGQGDVNEHLPAVISEAFEAVRRQLIKTKDKLQGEVKGRPGQEELTGHVIRLFTDRGYGFLRTLEGRELYFHQNAVLNDDFERLEVGTGVRYFPSEGEEGPQASSVQIIDKPGVRVPKT
jgi:cold shock CspA family protein/ribosome-associated translation inhibitor RaiA